MSAPVTFQSDRTSTVGGDAVLVYRDPKLGYGDTSLNYDDTSLQNCDPTVEYCDPVLEQRGSTLGYATLISVLRRQSSAIRKCAA